MVDLLVLVDPDVCGAKPCNFLQRNLVDLVSLLLGVLHLSVEPLPVLNDILPLVPVVIKLFLAFTECEARISNSLSSIGSMATFSCSLA